MFSFNINMLMCVAVDVMENQSDSVQQISADLRQYRVVLLSNCRIE